MVSATRMRYPARVFPPRRPGLLLAALAVVLLGALFYLAAAHVTRQRALDRVEDEALRTARQQARLIDSELAKFRLLPIVLSEYGDLRDALVQGPASRAATRLDDKLASLARRTGAPVIYAIDSRGMTVSAVYAASDNLGAAFVDRDLLGAVEPTTLDAAVFVKAAGDVVTARSVVEALAAPYAGAAVRDSSELAEYLLGTSPRVSRRNNSTRRSRTDNS